MKLTILESPFWSDSGKQRCEYYTYALRAVRDSLLRGESPIASHLLYTLVLSDTEPTERRMGIEAGHSWICMADFAAVYYDYGISKGMAQGIAEANACGLTVKFRKISKNIGTIFPPREYWVETSGVCQHHLFPYTGAPCYATTL